MSATPEASSADAASLGAWLRELGLGAQAGTCVESLNAGCFCVSLDGADLDRALQAQLGSAELVELVRERCPYLFSARPVFVSRAHMEKMAAVIAAVESVVALPAYREAVLSRSPSIARHPPGGARGVFFGYDFHVAEDDFGLIEVNTNAGGAMLNAVLGRAHRACCAPVARLGPSIEAAQVFEESIVEMFRTEWRLAGKPGPLRTIAIVDDAPADQYLYPEFLLFQRLFERHGIHAVVADPRELRLQGEALFVGDVPVDLVYNRLTDFYLDTDACEVLKSAWLEGRVVLTPHPQAHALYADKRNLALLSDAQALQELGVAAETRAVLAAGVPRTVIVDAKNADELWAARKRLFFKPFAGFGSRAAYRGDKVTQKVWSQIVAGGYVAQALVAPGERAVDAAADKPLKFDLREYTYAGQVQWTAARLYQGQTTNFRTPGGGFAPVYRSPC